MKVYRDWGGNVIKLAKKRRRCPRCGKMHRWPTEDKLCRKCEVAWVEECNENWDHIGPSLGINS
jgi:hypothetical protein